MPFFFDAEEHLQPEDERAQALMHQHDESLRNISTSKSVMVDADDGYADAIECMQLDKSLTLSDAYARVEARETLASHLDISNADTKSPIAEDIAYAVSDAKRLAARATTTQCNVTTAPISVIAETTPLFLTAASSHQ